MKPSEFIAFETWELQNRATPEMRPWPPDVPDIPWLAGGYTTFFYNVRIGCTARSR